MRKGDTIMNPNHNKLVAYYRVSTAKQGKDGLGMEAQRAAVQDFAKRTSSQIIKEYVEVETGTAKRNRPELAKALAHAKRSQGTMAVAKLDRLSRNVAFLSALMESKTDFVACDNPNANPLTIHILVAVAEDEAKRISERTRAALAAYIARGGRLGNPSNLTPAAARKGRLIGAEMTRLEADAAYADLYPVLTAKRESGMTLQAITDHLNGEGYVTRRGKPWNRMQVKLVLDRAARLS
jgi:DNA invertase Pin-like site-specific DNA recombinase